MTDTDKSGQLTQEEAIRRIKAIAAQMAERNAQFARDVEARRARGKLEPEDGDRLLRLMLACLALGLVVGGMIGVDTDLALPAALLALIGLPLLFLIMPSPFRLRSRSRAQSEDARKMREHRDRIRREQARIETQRCR